MQYSKVDFSIFQQWKKAKMSFIVFYACIPCVLSLYLAWEYAEQEEKLLSCLLYLLCALVFMIIANVFYYKKCTPISDVAKYIYVKDDHCVWRVDVDLLNILAEPAFLPWNKGATIKTMHELNDAQWHQIKETFQMVYQEANHDYVRIRMRNKNAQATNQWRYYRGDIVLLPLYDLQVEKEGDWYWTCGYHDLDGKKQRIRIGKAYENFMPANASHGFSLGNAFLRYHLITMIVSLVLCVLFLMQL